MSILNQYFGELPNYEEDNENDQSPPLGVPSLDRSNVNCPFCLKKVNDLYCHVLRCYIKACKNAQILPLCSCPEHLGVGTHDVNQRKRKYSDEGTDQLLDSQVPNFSPQKNSDANNTNIESKKCIAEQVDGFHRCSSNYSITTKSVKILFYDCNGSERIMYVCNLSFLSSVNDQIALKNYLESRLSGYDNVEMDQNDECTIQNCYQCGTRNDLHLMKPKGQSTRLDFESSLRFCSVDHMIKFLANTSENRWDKNCLVKNRSKCESCFSNSIY